MALERGDRLQGRATGVGLPGLDLHEGHQVALAGDEIEVVAPQPKAVRLHVPAARGEIRDGGALAGRAAAVSAVGPVADGNEAPVGSHGRRIGEERRDRGTLSARARTKFSVAPPVTGLAPARPGG